MMKSFSRNTSDKRPRPARYLLVGALSLMLAGCSADGSGDKEVFGTLLGAGLGAWLGSEIGGSGDSEVVGAAIGTLVGASIGNNIGRSLDEADRLAMQQARYSALEATPSGQRSEWLNPDSGNSGWYEPKPAYQNSEGQYCREYTQTIIVGGEEVEGYGTACRQADGSWKIIAQQ